MRTLARVRTSDGTHKIFINTRGNKDDVDDEMKFFLRYIENSTESLAAQSNSPLLRQIHQKVEQIRNIISKIKNVLQAIS